MKESKWRDFKNRTLLSLTIIACVALLIFFSQILWMKAIVALAVLGITGIATTELVALAGSKEKYVPLPWIITAAISLGSALFLSSQIPFFSVFPFFVFFVSMCVFFLLSFSHIEGALVRTSFSIFSLVYVTLPLGLLFFILYSPSYDGRMWIAYLLMVTKIGDIGAYLGGKLLGKRPLAPRLSPRKTWEGAIVGSLLSILVSLLFCYFGAKEGFALSWTEGVVLGFVLSFLGHTGDLAESLLKRDAQVKDSSCIPGLGGMLDMVDSLLFTIPLLYLFLLSR